MIDSLITLQRAIESRAVPDADPSSIDRLCITMVDRFVHLDFYGDSFGESYRDVLETVASPSVASFVASLDIRGPDEGCNGTRNWDLTPLASSKTSFPNLRRLSIEQTKPADHNRSIVADTYEENGVLAKILAKAPTLQELVTPSAPNGDFFQTGKSTLRYLSVDTGFDNQGFIAKLAESSCFPDLVWFAFGEYNETYMDDFATHLTPFADYRRLLLSDAFARVRTFEWRNPACSSRELEEVAALKRDRQILIVRWSADYLRAN